MPVLPSMSSGNLQERRVPHGSDHCRSEDWLNSWSVGRGTERLIIAASGAWAKPDQTKIKGAELGRMTGWISQVLVHGRNRIRQPTRSKEAEWGVMTGWLSQGLMHERNIIRQPTESKAPDLGEKGWKVLGKHWKENDPSPKFTKSLSTEGVQLTDDCRSWHSHVPPVDKSRYWHFFKASMDLDATDAV